MRKACGMTSRASLLPRRKSRGNPHPMLEMPFVITVFRVLTRVLSLLYSGRGEMSEFCISHKSAGF